MPCNRLTAKDESVIAFLSRIKTDNDGTETPQQLAELRKCLEAIRRDYPDAYASLRPSHNTVRKFLRENKIERPPGIALTDFPIVSAGRPEFIQPIRNFGIKLSCALHYKHTGKIAPSDATIAVRLLTNVQLQQDAIEERLLGLFNARPMLVRARQELASQFDYVYAIATDNPTTAYMCRFRQSFVVLGIIATTGLPSEFDEDPGRGAFKGTPFRHGEFGHG